MKRLQHLSAALALASLTTVCAVAHSADLTQAWQAAQAHDPEYAAARALYEQAALRQEQARALWAPAVMATGAVGVGGADSRTHGAQAMGMNDVSFKTNINLGALTRAGIGAQQAWISPERDAQSQQLELSAQLMQAQWRQAEQTLMLRTAEKYLDVISAQQSLGIVQRQQQTVQQAAAEIKKRQTIGDASLMDVHEANARVSNIQAQVLALENELAMKKLAYRQRIGQEPTALQTLAAIHTAGHDLPDAATWVQQAKQQSPVLQMLRLQQAIQAQEAKRIQASQALSVDWVAQASMDRLMGQGMYGSASNQALSYMVGVQVNAPLGKGSLADARAREALKQVEKLRFDEELATLQTEQQVRSAWQNISTSQARLQALAQSDSASQARLSATRNAHRTGARTTNEWLGAQHDAAQTELALVQLRAQTALERLRLHAACGLLTQTQLRETHAWLK